MAVVAQRHPAYAALRTEPSAGLTPSMGAADTFGLLRRWQQYLEVSGRANANTRRQYGRAMTNFLADVLGDPANEHLSCIGDVTEDDVVECIRRIPPQGGARAQVLKALHSFYGWAERRRYLPDNPVKGLPIPRRKYGRAPTLEEDQREALFAAAELVDPRARPTMELMYATGARLGSICGVLPEDITRGKDGRWSVEFRVAKNDDPYQVPLNAQGRAAVERLVELLGWQPLRAARRRPTLVGVGPGVVWSWVHEASDRAGLRVDGRRVWPHLLRHAFATDLEDVDDRTWAALMHHRDASLRTRYAAPNEARMIAAVDALH